MNLLYGTTTSLVVTIAEQFYGSMYYLYFADNVNAWPQNPPSSNPFQIFLDYAEIVRTNDRYNPKYIAHRRGVRRGIRKKMSAGAPARQAALRTINVMGTHGLQPYLAILEKDAYEANRGGARIQQLPPPSAGSPTSVEYLLPDVHGPNHPVPELHLQKLHF